MAQSMMQAKLCPHCANSVALEAVKCPYCKAELSAAQTHEWPDRGEEPAALKPTPGAESRNVKSKVMMALALLVCALGGYFVGSQRSTGGFAPAADNALTDLQEKEQKIQTLEAELAKLREGNQSSSSQLEDFKAKLDEREKDLAAAQKKLTDANQEVDRLSSSRAAAASRPAARSADPLPASPPASPMPTRRAAEPGIYQTLRSTPVYEAPSNSSRVLTQVERATRVTVIGSVGDWLEVRSRYGNPPGFIRADDAMFVARAN